MHTTLPTYRHVALRSLLLATNLLVACLFQAHAQSYPNKPVRVVVPWPAGGLVDVAARQLGSRLQTSLGQPFVVENKLGSGGNIGADQVVKASADGSITEEPKLIKSSGVKAWDDAVLRAIDKMEALPRDTDGRVPPLLVIVSSMRDLASARTGHVQGYHQQPALTHKPPPPGQRQPGRASSPRRPRWGKTGPRRRAANQN